MSDSRRRRIVVFANRRKLTGRKHRLVQDVIAGLTRLGHRVSLAEITPLEGTLDVDPAIAGGHFDQAVVAGGDGTFNRVLQDWDRPDVPLALIPLGTLNLVATECGYPRDAAALTRVIDECRWRLFYPAVAGGEVFAIGAGCGIDSFLLGSVDRTAKQRWGRPYLVWKLLAALFRYSWPEFEVRLDGTSTVATSICVLKGRYYGGPFRFTRHTSIFNPSLYAALAGRQRIRRAIGVVAVLSRAHWLIEKTFTVKPLTEIEINTPTAFPFHVDGDVRIALPVRVALRARPLRLCVPSTLADHPDH